MHPVVSVNLFLVDMVKQTFKPMGASDFDQEEILAETIWLVDLINGNRDIIHLHKMTDFTL